MEILDKLFGSQAKVRVIRLFLFNPGETYDISEISDKLDLGLVVVRREVQLLERIGLLRRRIYSKEITRKRGRTIVVSRKRTQGFNVEPSFPYLAVLQGLLINTNLIPNKEILRRLQGCGKLKLVILAGVFTRDPESRVDILVVGDNISHSKIKQVIRGFETSIGKELQYASFETSDFNYRSSMYDKLIRDILDYPHETIVDRLGITVKTQR